MCTVPKNTHIVTRVPSHVDIILQTLRRCGGVDPTWMSLTDVKCASTGIERYAPYSSTSQLIVHLR